MNARTRWPRPPLLLAGLAAVAIGASFGGEAPSAAVNEAGRFVWHDLMTENMAGSRAFYGALLGWTFQTIRESEPAYAVIKHGDQYIDGIVAVKRENPSVPVSQWRSYIAV